MQALSTDTDAPFLAPGDYVDSDHPTILEAAARIVSAQAPEAERARAIFYAVRDLRYECDSFADLETWRASSVLAAGQGYCVGKASLFAALARVAGLAAKVAFADVTNHLASERLLARMGSAVFAWHGYNQVRIDGRWVTICTAFDPKVCERFGVAPLEFDGAADAFLQPFNGEGRAFMAYLKVHGSFQDTPARFLRAEMARLYPEVARPDGIPADLRRSAPTH